MVENKYYCQNCKAELKPTDTVCPNCGKNLSEVGRSILVTVTETLSLSDAVSVEKLSPEQESLVEKIWGAIKEFPSSMELDSVTINFGFAVFVFKRKKRINGM